MTFGTRIKGSLLLTVAALTSAFLRAQDRTVPSDLGRDYEAAARARGDNAKLIVVESAGHFEVIDPGSTAWPAIENAVYTLLEFKKPASQH